MTTREEGHNLYDQIHDLLNNATASVENGYDIIILEDNNRSLMRDLVSFNDENNDIWGKTSSDFDDKNYDSLASYLKLAKELQLKINNWLNDRK